MSTHLHSIVAFLGVQPFFVVTGLAAVVFIAAIFFGAARWQQTNGKAITIVAGLLLLLLVGFVAVVFSIERNPM